MENCGYKQEYDITSNKVYHFVLYVVLSYEIAGEMGKP